MALVPVARGRASAGRPAELAAALRAARASENAPGAQAAIVACGQIVWSGADGVTDLRSKRKVTNSTPFVLASATKTVTAAMIMQQVQAGKLSLSTPLSRFYPKIPNAAMITVRMLLNMTSGLSEAEDANRIAQIQDIEPRHRWTRSELISAIGKPLFPPGKKFRYTNTNYTVLGGILEQVSQLPIESYFQRSIATPAGMTSSTWTPSKTVIDRLAHPYTEENGSLKDWWVNGFGPPSYYYGPVFTAGGLVSTATDLARFGNALFRTRLVNAANLAQMTKLGRGDYGLGLTVGDFAGRTWYGHSGSFQGYESEDWTDPKHQVTVAITTNKENAGEHILDAVADAYDRSHPAACA